MIKSISALENKLVAKKLGSTNNSEILKHYPIQKVNVLNSEVADMVHFARVKEGKVDKLVTFVKKGKEAILKEFEFKKSPLGATKQLKVNKTKIVNGEKVSTVELNSKQDVINGSKNIEIKRKNSTGEVVETVGIDKLSRSDDAFISERKQIVAENAESASEISRYMSISHQNGKPSYIRVEKKATEGSFEKTLGKSYRNPSSKEVQQSTKDLKTLETM